MAEQAKSTENYHGLVGAIKRFKDKYPNVWQFIMFNIFSNVATITNFVVLWISDAALKNVNAAFSWWIFHYSTDQGGLGGFIAFLLAYVCSQIVNFFVQRKVVFGSHVEIRRVIVWYILTVTVAGIISVWLPPYIIGLTKPAIGGWAPTVANIVNIVVQVAINWPMMKFVIMK
ncbi:GtrA family protein [Limosilactobacillus difficilis]|uniref:GtrA family protein n=1 Tax=Limosilactobacillus difficilis TaxID=2991838 RepID=UPI0024BA7E57|nr:GtrA family protein [Limosilactobacillus difficilis]